MTKQIVIYKTKESKIHEGIPIDSYVLITTPSKLMLRMKKSVRLGGGGGEVIWFVLWGNRHPL